MVECLFDFIWCVGYCSCLYWYFDYVDQTLRLYQIRRTMVKSFKEVIKSIRRKKRHALTITDVVVSIASGCIAYLVFKYLIFPYSNHNTIVNICVIFGIAIPILMCSLGVGILVKTYIERKYSRLFYELVDRQKHREYRKNHRNDNGRV